MKKIFSLLALGLLLAVSCEKEGPMTINHITDLYDAPAGATVMQLSNATSTWATDRRYFDLNFSNLSTRLVGYDALLKPGQYVIGADQQGSAINTKADGQNASEGFITVNEKDGQYQITATIGGKVYYWTGALPFQADPAPTELTEVLQAQSNKQNGVNSLTMQLATPGISQEFDMTTWQTVWKGEGGYLALDIYSDDGYLHDGTYTACAEGGVINPGEFGIGYDTTMQWGDQVYEMKDWGTCWWEVKDGAATATKITDGIVNVSSREEKVDGKDVTIWTIAWGAKYPLELIFEGAIPALTKPKKPDGPVQLDYTYVIGEPAQCSTQSGEIVAGVMKYPFIISDNAGQEVAYLELVLNEGQTAEIEGEYVSTEYAHEAGQLANGYYLDYSDWGWGIIAGGSYYVGADGEKVYIDPGVTVIVTKVATGAFRFTSTGFDYAAAGPDYVPGGGGEEGDDDVTGDVVLKLTSGLTYSMEDVTAGNTAADGSALSGMTLWRVTVSDGSGTVAAFDLGTAAGSEDLAGTYTVMSYPDAVGKAGNGWGFAAWGMFGGCYFLLDGAYYFIPADATITVSNKSDGTIKIKFEGAVQKDDYSDGGQGGLLLDNVAKS